ncbi:hypothetical protein Tco_1497613, partial [Tanacetum coccineum]
MMMVVCYDDGEDGGGGSGVVEVARGASGIVDRVDPEVGSVFGVGRKNPAGKVFWRCGNDAQDSERTDSDDDENPSFTLKDYEEEEQDEEYV